MKSIRRTEDLEEAALYLASDAELISNRLAEVDSELIERLADQPARLLEYIGRRATDLRRQVLLGPCAAALDTVGLAGLFLRRAQETIAAHIQQLRRGYWVAMALDEASAAARP